MIRPPRLSLRLLCCLLVLCATLASLLSSCQGQQQHMQFMDLCPPHEIPASANVTDLTELTFWGRVADGRVWLVEFYAGD